MTAPPPSPEGAPPGRVLVVDDELLIRWSLREGLTEAGFEVSEAGTAADARACFHDAIDAVLLDIRLPDADGLALLQELRQRGPSALVVLMISAHASPELVQAAKSAGAVDVLHKPFKVDGVVARLQAALDGVRAPSSPRT